MWPIRSRCSQRIVADTLSGELLRHIYVTLRLSVIGFAIGCAFGVLLPFVLRRVPRLSNAIEPYIMASVGVPKYALVPLFILWFGIDDAPKLCWSACWCSIRCSSRCSPASATSTAG